MLKNVVTGYPLKLVANKVEETKSDFQPEFIEKMIQRINYDALYDAAQVVGFAFLSNLSRTNNKYKRVSPLFFCAC
jgi:hypothetical protein